MKRFAWLLMLPMGPLFVPACSTVDPTDKDTLLGAIGNLTAEQQRRLSMAAGLHDACDEMMAWARGITNLDDAFHTLGWDCGDKAVGATAGNANLDEWCREWDGEGLFREHMKAKAREAFAEADCIPSEALGEAFQKVQDKVKEAAASERVVELLLVGAIAPELLANIAPELLPVLCSLGKGTYCQDTPGAYDPTPLPAPTNPPDPDAP